MSKELNQEQNQEEEKTIARGYVIGIDESQHIVFQIIGENVELTELIGMHKIAELKIETATQSNMNTGWPLVMSHNIKIAEAVLEIVKVVKELSRKIDSLNVTPGK